MALGLHGWSRRNGWHTWQPLMAPLAEAGYYVVSVDMPGWGQSPPLHDRPLARHEAGAVVLAIMDALDPDRAAILMGKSWGGGLALDVALDHPNRVRALILTAPAFMDFDRLAALQPPVLLAWAEDDPVIPIQYATHYDTIPSIKFVTYATGGHSAASENATAFAPVAIDFLHEISTLPRGNDQRRSHHE